MCPLTLNLENAISDSRSCPRPQRLIVAAATPIILGLNSLPPISLSLALQESPQDSAITRDINRTFPAHDYFKDTGGDGQDSLYKICKVP